MSQSLLIEEKLDQAARILNELGIDAWLTFVRESATLHDPCLDLIVGTDCTWQSAFILTATGERIAIVGSLDKAHFDSLGLYHPVLGYVGSIREPLVETLTRLAPAKIAINRSKSDVMSDGLTVGLFEVLLDHLAATELAGRLVSSEPIVAALRGRKTAEERRRIKAACDLTVEMFHRLTPRLHTGLTEKQVAALLREEVARAGVEPAWDAEMCPAVFTGPESAGAHCGPTDRPIEPGHVLNIDFGVRLNGFCSDLQRTWYFMRAGETSVPQAVQRGFDTILEAIREAARALRPGRRCVEIDTIARSYITERGYPEYPHALGHQIGRKAHDGAGVLCPRWERYGSLPDALIEAGQCYTIEPRLPIEGHGIATLEEIVVVEEDGCTFLSEPQEKLFVVRS
ncbi:MAG: Xaa-Pro peptidase family protein [Planctomycetota bacterium]